TRQIDVLKSCYIAVPSAFTPNGDGLNDYLYPLNAFKADNLEFRVYNRWGQLVFSSGNWLSKWDGTIGGHPAPSDTYVWMLRYVDRDTGKTMFQKGTSLLIR
ncbi:MAG TPA: gliding motility-associated C-terminal domain-containing protein, partial [Puia sp.]